MNNDLLKRYIDFLVQNNFVYASEWTGPGNVRQFTLCPSLQEYLFNCPALCPNGGEIGCDFALIPYKHSSFPDIPFGMPDFKLFCFQPLKSMLSLM